MTCIAEIRKVDHCEKMTTVYLPFGNVSLPLTTNTRLEEWSSWARKKLNLDPHGHCASAEGQFKKVSGGDGFELDLSSVLAVERVVTGLPDRYKQIIRRHYIFRQSPKAIAKNINIPEKTFRPELRWAVLMVKNGLTRYHGRN